MSGGMTQSESSGVMCQPQLLEISFLDTGKNPMYLKALTIKSMNQKENHEG